MNSPLESLIQTGTKLWLDSIDPELVIENRAQGATGATSNPVIVSALLESGRFDSSIERMIAAGLADSDIAWQLTDQLVDDAQAEFLSVWRQTQGNDGYVSFEIDPLLEDPSLGLSHADRVSKYIELGLKWSAGHDNRMIKIPATAAGIASLEELCAAGVTLNVTLIFTAKQYRAARDAVWAGAQRRPDGLDAFKSAYSIFVSRIDVYTEQHVPQLSGQSQGQVGIVNAKRIWQENSEFWSSHPTPLDQEIIFASTGTKKAEDPAWKYVAAFAGGDIQTNPPSTNAAVAESGMEFSRSLDQLPSPSILSEIDEKVSFQQLEDKLMEEGIQKFADPQKSLLSLIAAKRATLTSAG